MDEEMMKALEADGEMLRSLTGEDHGPYFFTAPSPDLKLCPFCGGEAEMDTRRAYRKLSNGDIGDAVAIYCLGCSADMNACRADHSGLSDEDLIYMVKEMWNRRASDAARQAALDEAIQVCGQKLLVFDGAGDVKIGVEMAGKLLIEAIRRLKQKDASSKSTEA